MNPDTFFEHFDLLVDAPNGVQKLREMILQLAVQGKLVPQNSDDEPASVLLERIRAEKDRLVKQGKIKKSEPLPPVSPDEMPYGLPDGWEWIRLKEISHDLGQEKPSSTFTYIDVSSINKEKGIISDDIKILEAKDAPSRARKIVSLGTVIYSTVRPYLLNIAIVDKTISPKPIVSTAVAVLHPFPGVLDKFLYYYLRSLPFIKFVESEMSGMAYPAISDSKLSVGPVPLPPSQEQARIVAKVDQLMALCDSLETKLARAGTNSETLITASIRNLIAA